MTETPSRSGPEPSLGQLVGKMTETVSSLVRDEIQLVQTQLTEKGKALGAGGAMFAAAGVFALFGLGWLLHAGFLGLTELLQPWAAALVLGGAVLVVAGLLALVGKSLIGRAPAPQTKENLAKDIEAIKEGVQS